MGAARAGAGRRLKLSGNGKKKNGLCQWLALAAAVAKLLENPDLGHRMGRLGAQRAKENLSWDVGKAALVDLYARMFARECAR